MSRRQLAKGFQPRGEGKWYELESVAGEARVRWAGEGADAVPQSLDVSIGTDGKVRELVFTLRPDDAKGQIQALGGPAPSGLTKYEAPSSDVVIAPGLGQWTVRLSPRDVRR